MSKKTIKRFQEVMAAVFVIVSIGSGAVLTMSMNCGDHVTASGMMICFGMAILGLVSCTM